MLKFISLFLALFLIFLLTAMFLKWINPLVFYISAIVIGIIAYKVIPRIKK